MIMMEAPTKTEYSPTNLFNLFPRDNPANVKSELTKANTKTAISFSKKLIVNVNPTPKLSKLTPRANRIIPQKLISNFSSSPAKKSLTIRIAIYENIIPSKKSP